MHHEHVWGLRHCIVHTAHFRHHYYLTYVEYIFDCRLLAAIKKEYLRERLGMQLCQFTDGNNQRCTRGFGGTQANVSPLSHKVMRGHQFCFECYELLHKEGLRFFKEPADWDVFLSSHVQTPWKRAKLTKQWKCAKAFGGACPVSFQIDDQRFQIVDHWKSNHSKQLWKDEEEED